MKNYKCNHCNHKWSTDEDPFECPNCHETDFEEVGSNGISKWLKIGGIALIVIIVLILLLKGCCSGKTIVKSEPDNSKCKLTVAIEGDHSKEYKIILRKDGAVYGQQNKKDKAVFSDLDGTYSLDVQFTGNGKLPEINNYQRTFTFTKPPKAPEIPQITATPQTPNKLTSRIKVYSVTVITDVSIVPLKETEFSSDGTNWQGSNVFNNLRAGTYTFYARNTRDESLQDQKQLQLEPYIPTPPPTVAQLNALLTQIANKKQVSLDSFIKLLGSNTKVTGIINVSTVGELANEAYIQEQEFQVKNINIVNGEVVSITVE